MWSAIWDGICKAFGAIFSFMKPQRADFEAVVKIQNEVIGSMQNRIDTMDHEFKQACDRYEARIREQDERNESRIRKQDERIAECEKAEGECRKRLAVALGQLEQMTALKEKVKILMEARTEADRIRSMKDDPEYQKNTMAQVKTLLEGEAAKQTKVDP